MAFFHTLRRSADLVAHDTDAWPRPMRVTASEPGMAAACGPARRQAVRKMPMSSPMRRADDCRDAWKVDEWWCRYGDTQLNALIALALRDRPDVGVACARIQQALQHAQRPEGASVSALNAASTAPAQRDSMARFGAELEAWSTQHRRFAGATSHAEAALAGRAHATRALTSSIAIAYFEFDGLHARLADAVAASKSHARIRELLRVRLTHRLELQHGLRQLEVREARTLETLLSIDAAIARQRRVIAVLAGEADATRRALVRPALDVGAFQRLPYSLPLDLLGRRPDVIASRRFVDATARRAAAATTCFYPDVNMSSLIGQQPLGLGQLSDDRSIPGSAGLARSLPIHDRIRSHPDRAATPDAHDDAVDRYRACLVRALNEVVDAARDQLALDAQIARAHAAMSAAGAARASIQDRHGAATANSAELLEREDDLQAKRRELAGLQIRRLRLDADLAHALGGGFDLFARLPPG